MHLVHQWAKMAAELNDSRIKMVLARAREAAVRKTRDCDLQDSQLYACMKTFMESRRAVEERARRALQRLKEAGRESNALKIAAEAAQQEVRRQKLALAAEAEEAKRTDEEFKALKNFSGEMLGAGRENGGTKEHRKNRMEFMDRVRKHFPPLSHWHANN